MSVSFIGDTPTASSKPARRAGFHDPNAPSPSKHTTNNRFTDDSPRRRTGDADPGVAEANKAFDAFRNFHQRGGEDRLNKVMSNREGRVEGATHKTIEGGSGGVPKSARSNSFSPVRGHSSQSHQRRGEARGHLATDMYPQRRDAQVEHAQMQRRHAAGSLEAPVYLTERVKGDGNVGSSGQRSQEDLLYDRNQKRDTVAPTMFDIDPSDPQSYTYGGEASYAMAFSHTNDTDATEDERQSRYREKHEQTFAALGNMKPFLKTLFGNDDDNELEWGQARRNKPADDEFGSVQPMGSANSAAGGGGGAGVVSTSAVDRSRALYNTLASSRHATRETPATASSVLPSFSYHDMVARESVKPLILQTTTTTDRCPLTTKTCAPTFTVFNTAPYVASTGDADAGLYFAENASRTTEARRHNAKTFAMSAMRGSMGANHGGSHVHIPSSSYTTRMPHMFSTESVNNSGTVSDGRIMSDKMSSGMRVFRDMMLPTTKMATDGVEGRSTYYDEKELVKQAQLRMLLQTIQDAKPVSERSHMPPRKW